MVLKQIFDKIIAKLHVKYNYSSEYTSIMFTLVAIVAQLQLQRKSEETGWGLSKEYAPKSIFHLTKKLYAKEKIVSRSITNEFLPQNKIR